ncbi:hypothetical protein [Anaerococcus degeneri]|uniref:Uncharacterized protein n=1 Tax=Anaerococcus degeneri TaxID=361500 RepID=A0ABS7YX50_9FIRM|nr:hypothetical protein [Anaerococcus degeneri]MBP2015412.1 hypothetical protein [Anaerococcus degeneri]MCA2096306.1 hypothetical protein [Anaerococcus degeneri]
MEKNKKAHLLIGLSLLILALVLGQGSAIPDMARGLVTGLGLGFLILSTGIEDKCKRKNI